MRTLFGSLKADHENKIPVGRLLGDIYKSSKAQIFLHYESAKSYYDRYIEAQQRFKKPQTGLVRYVLCVQYITPPATAGQCENVSQTSK